MLKVRASHTCIGVSLTLWLIMCYNIFHHHTDWTLTLSLFGFSLVMACLAVIFEWLAHIDKAFLEMTKALSGNIQQLVEMNRLLSEKPSYMTISFTPMTATSAQEERLDLLSLEELQERLREAEQKQLYERAAQIHREILSRKG